VKDKRFGITEQDVQISPAQYNPHEPVYSQSVQTSLSSAFVKPKHATITNKYSGASLVRTRAGWKPTPGPTEYNVKVAVKEKNIAGFAFKVHNTKSIKQRPKTNETEDESIKKLTKWTNQLQKKHFLQSPFSNHLRF
jgi:hypothetical protein